MDLGKARTDYGRGLMLLLILGASAFSAAILAGMAIALPVVAFGLISGNRTDPVWLEPAVITAAVLLWPLMAGQADLKGLLRG